jgi:hypothetical protein
MKSQIKYVLCVQCEEDSYWKKRKDNAWDKLKIMSSTIFIGTGCKYLFWCMKSQLTTKSNALFLIQGD